MAAPNEHVHGSNGAWVAGEWLDIEDCAEHFNIQGASHTTGTLTRNCATCPRSRTRHGTPPPTPPTPGKGLNETK